MVEQLPFRRACRLQLIVDQFPSTVDDGEGLELRRILGRPVGLEQLGEGGQTPPRLPFTRQRAATLGVIRQEQRQQAPTLRGFRDRQAAELEERRHQVDGPNRLGDHGSVRNTFGRPNSTRGTLVILAVDIVVPMTPVIQELLAVVADEREHRLRSDSELLKRLDDSSELRVHGPDGAVVPVHLVLHKSLGIDAGGAELCAARLPLGISLPSKCLEMAWSPDGRFFACVDVDNRSYQVTQLWFQPASGGGAILVTERRTRDYNPTWSTDGRYLFFVSGRGGSMDLWRQGIGADGRPEGDTERLSVALETRTAALSPNGHKIAYSRGFRVGNVWRVPLLEDRPAAWEDAQQITYGQDPITTVRLAADHRSLLLTLGRAGNDDVWRQPIAGGAMSRVTVDPTLDWSPSESPDGTEIAFHSFRSGNRDIWVMPAQGGPARALAPHPAMDRFPSWSPDGREIAFSSNRGGPGGVWVVPAEGGDARQVTDDASEETFPVWSPDGKDLIFSSKREDGISRLWRVPARGGEAVRLSAGPGFAAQWSVDGKTLYFLGQNERANNIWALSPEDGTEQPVTDLSARYGRMERFSLDTDGEYLYFIWAEDLGDIWVMDVVTDESK